jgi:hypothetical protein
MRKDTQLDTAYTALTIRVLVPINDLDNIFKSVNELQILILDIKSHNKKMVVLELYLENAFNLYALGKMVGYNEVFNK